MSKVLVEQALNHLVNLQPVMANGLLDKRQLAFIDPHIDEAIAALRAALKQDPALLQEPVYYRSPTGSGHYAYSRFSAALDHPEPLYAAPQQAQQAVSKGRIREIFLAAGFTIKEGQTDLKPYVYEAANALLNEAAKPAQQPEVDKLLRQALGALEETHGWNVANRINAIVAIRKHLGDA